jgi:hypothetical protein
VMKRENGIVVSPLQCSAFLSFGAALHVVFLCGKRDALFKSESTLL